jgi:fructose-1,6-bisphosphatase II / sedoheptulose-1,7-bisphosphatase
MSLPALHWRAAGRRHDIGDLVVLILDRPRHHELIAAVRKTGARIRLIRDGDVAGVIATARPNTGIDIYMGIGGAPEGVLAAAALRSIGGQMQGRLSFRNDDEKVRAQRMGITDFDRVYDLHDLAAGDVMFAATGVTDGTMLAGVRRFAGGVITQSIIMRSKTGTVRVIETEHYTARKREVVPEFATRARPRIRSRRRSSARSAVGAGACAGTTRRPRLRSASAWFCPRWSGGC